MLIYLDSLHLFSAQQIVFFHHISLKEEKRQAYPLVNQHLGPFPLLPINLVQ